mgnify:CR=1 FL=1
MIFPAWLTFADDERVTNRLFKVYHRWACRTLYFREVRGEKSASIARLLSLDEADVSRALTQLVEWGYLIEHPRVNRVRMFTLAWRVREDLRAA